MEEHKECSICLEEIEENDDIKKLINCDHIFHKSCIDTWSNNNNTCPLCRKEFCSKPKKINVLPLIRNGK